MYVLNVRIEWVAKCKATIGTRLYRRLMIMRRAISGSRSHYPVLGIFASASDVRKDHNVDTEIYRVSRWIDLR